MMCHIDPDWTPTAENINALPEPVRKFIHDLETLAGPAGIVRENAIARDIIRGLERLVREGPAGGTANTRSRGATRGRAGR